MENDSLNEQSSAVSTPDNAVMVPDSAAAMPDGGSLTADANAMPQMPTAEQLGISVVSGVVGEDGSPQPMAVTVGDTFDFPVTVSWSVNGSALLVLPTSSANAKGITQLGVSQESARSVKDGKEVASITFTYKLVAQDTGDLHIPAMKFEIPTQMGTPIEMRSENVPLRVDSPFNPLPVIVGVAVAFCLVVAGLWRARRRAAARANAVAKNAAQDALREKMMVLKQRANTADSREWLLELENICKETVPEKFVPAAESAANGAAGASANGSASANGTAAGSDDGWDALLKEFAHARYGGGQRDAFELREIWKAAMKLMGVEEE